MNLKYVFIEKKNRHLELIKNNPLIEHMKIKNDRNKVLHPFSFVIGQLKTEEKYIFGVSSQNPCFHDNLLSHLTKVIYSLQFSGLVVFRIA